MIQRDFSLEFLKNIDLFGRARSYMQHIGSLSMAACKLLSCGIWSLVPFACMLSRLSCVWLFVTLWTLAREAPLSSGTSQARILEWVAASFSRGSSRPRDRTLRSYRLLPWQAGSLPLASASWGSNRAPWSFVALRLSHWTSREVFSFLFLLKGTSLWVRHCSL